MAINNFVDTTEKSNSSTNRLSQIVSNIVVGIIVVVAGYFVLSSVIADLSETFAKLKAEQEKESKLEQKLASLNKIDTTLLDRSNQALVVLPEENSASYFMGNVRKTLEEEKITTTDISIRSQSEELKGIDQSSIEFSTEADDLESARMFLQKIKSSAPISTLDTLEIDTSLNNKYGLKMGYSTYWASLPTTIPPISEPLVSLQAEDESLLELLLKLTPPQQIKIGDNSENVGRANPFQ